MSDNLNDLRDLFNAAQDDGLSQHSANLLVHNLNGTTAPGCVGAQADDLNTDDVTLLVVVLDMSSSMSSVRRDVIDGFNEMIAALRDSRLADSILASCWVFHDEPVLLFGYTPVESVPPLSGAQYQPQRATALYDAALNAFTGLVAYGQALRSSGIRTNHIVVVLSDGGDNSSSHRSAEVKQLAGDLLKQETYTLAFLGFGDPHTFNQIAADMGFPNVLTVQHSAAEIRRALGTVSQSVIRASRTQIGGPGGAGPVDFFNVPFSVN